MEISNFNVTFNSFKKKKIMENLNHQLRECLRNHQKLIELVQNILYKVFLYQGKVFVKERVKLDYFI